MVDVDIFSVTPLLGLVSSPLNNIDSAPSLAVCLQLTMISVLYNEVILLLEEQCLRHQA